MHFSDGLRVLLASMVLRVLIFGSQYPKTAMLAGRETVPLLATMSSLTISWKNPSGGPVSSTERMAIASYRPLIIS